MARPATTSDVFNAVAEPRRREILCYLAPKERPVSEIVERLGLRQPSVSKHLRVLREVGLVGKRRDGRNAVYRIKVEAMLPFHEWINSLKPTLGSHVDIATSKRRHSKRRNRQT